MISPDNALKNVHRRRLYEAVTRAPGASVAALARAVGLPHMAAHYHLCVLEQHRLVASRGPERPRLYFPIARCPPDPREAAAVHLLACPQRRAVAHALVSLPRGGTYVQLAVRAGLPPARVAYHLRRLASGGFVEATRSRPRRFAAAPRLFAHLAAVAPAMAALTPSAPPPRAAP